MRSTSIGIVDVPGFVALINHEDREVGRLAAQQVASLSDIPAAAIPLLIVALGSDDASIRLGAAAGIVTAGPQAGAVAEALAEAIVKSYPPEHNPMRPYEPGSEMVYWLALSKIGAGRGRTHHRFARAQEPVCAGSGRADAWRHRSDSQIGGGQAEIGAVRPVGERHHRSGVCALPHRREQRRGPGHDEARDRCACASDIPILAIAAVPRMGESGKSLLPLSLGKLTSENPNARFAAVGLVGTLPPEEATKYTADVGKLALDRFPPIKQRAGIVLEKLGKAAAPAGPGGQPGPPGQTDEQLRDQFIDALTAMGPGAKPARHAAAAGPRLVSQCVQAHAACPSSRIGRSIFEGCPGRVARRSRRPRSGHPGDRGDCAGQARPASAERTDETHRHGSTRFQYEHDAFGGAGAAQAGPRAKPARGDLEAIAADTQVGLALWAKVGLAAIDGDIAKSAPAVRSALTDRRFPARTAGVEVLFLIGPTMSDLPALVKLLRDIESRTREFAARCIGAIGPQAKEAVPESILLLNDREGEVRIAAANALGEMGPAGLPAVEKLKDLRRDSLAASAAGKALEKLGVVEKK